MEDLLIDQETEMYFASLDLNPLKENEKYYWCRLVLSSESSKQPINLRAICKWFCSVQTNYICLSAVNPQVFNSIYLILKKSNFKNLLSDFNNAFHLEFFVEEEEECSELSASVLTSCLLLFIQVKLAECGWYHISNAFFVQLKPWEGGEETYDFKKYQSLEVNLIELYPSLVGNDKVCFCLKSSICRWKPFQLVDLISLEARERFESNEPVKPEFTSNVVVLPNLIYGTVLSIQKMPPKTSSLKSVKEFQTYWKDQYDYQLGNIAAFITVQLQESEDVVHLPLQCIWNASGLQILKTKATKLHSQTIQTFLSSVESFTWNTFKHSNKSSSKQEDASNSIFNFTKDPLFSTLGFCKASKLLRNSDDKNSQTPIPNTTSSQPLKTSGSSIRNSNNKNILSDSNGESSLSSSKEMKLTNSNASANSGEKLDIKLPSSSPNNVSGSPKKLGIRLGIAKPKVAWSDKKKKSGTTNSPSPSPSESSKKRKASKTLGIKSGKKSKTTSEKKH